MQRSRCSARSLRSRSPWERSRPDVGSFRIGIFRIYRCDIRWPRNSSRRACRSRTPRCGAMSFGDALDVLTEFAEAAGLGRYTALDECGVWAPSRLSYGDDRLGDDAHAFLCASEVTRDALREHAAIELLRIIRARAADVVSVDASYRTRKARQARELRARRALGAGRRPGVTGRPQNRKVA